VPTITFFEPAGIKPAASRLLQTGSYPGFPMGESSKLSPIHSAYASRLAILILGQKMDLTRTLALL